MKHNEIASRCRVALGALDLKLEDAAIYAFAKAHAGLCSPTPRNSLDAPGYIESILVFEAVIVGWAKERKREAEGSVLTRPCRHDFGLNEGHSDHAPKGYSDLEENHAL